MLQANQTKEQGKQPEILVIDGQGGGLGKSLILKIKEVMPNAKVIAIGTNSVASTTMLKAGADKVATGENSILWNASKASVITGGIGIVCANSMLGEISPAMANAVSSSDASKFLIPMSYCHIRIAGARSFTLPQLIDSTVEEIQEFFQGTLC